VIRPTFSLNSTLGEMLSDEAGAAVVGQMMSGMMDAAAGTGTPSPAPDPDIIRVMAAFPLVRMVSFSGEP
jgi:hypothetical protein